MCRAATRCPVVVLDAKLALRWVRAVAALRHSHTGQLAAALQRMSDPNSPDYGKFFSQASGLESPRVDTVTKDTSGIRSRP